MKDVIVFDKDTLIQQILAKTTVSKLAALVYPNIKRENDAGRALVYWFKKGYMPRERHERMQEILEGLPLAKKPHPNFVLRKVSAPKASLDDIPRRTDMDFPIEIYKRLAMAVVEAAATDYLKASKYLLRENRRKGDEEAAKADKYRCEQFFLGSQFPIFMESIDGQSFMEKLDDKVKHDCFR